MGVAFGVLYVDVAGDGGVEFEAELVVDAGASAGVAADVGARPVRMRSRGRSR